MPQVKLMPSKEVELMPRIDTLYVVNHSHTDIGFTDYQDLCFRQHCAFIQQALDICEATTDYPPEARYRWVCEVTGTTERWLRSASSEQLARFLEWHRRGAIDVAGMQYNLTPLLNVEQMIRSLYPIQRLRREFGLEITAAMQCDVNGISWIFADLLPAVGIQFLTMAVNPYRGGAPTPRPGAFWWEGPAGGRVLVWNGYHYLFGRSQAKLGDWRFVERFLPKFIEALEKDEQYPFPFLYCQATHPTRVDNGPPDPRMPEFVREWNASGRTPRIVFTTPSEFGRFLREQYGDKLPTLRGDWVDWWADGVASSAYETGLSRTTHELLSVTEALGAWLSASGLVDWDVNRLKTIYENVTLYDEHTWGAFASIVEPEHPWTKAQWNRKAGFVYSAWAETHDVLAHSAHAIARTLAEPGPEGLFNLGDLTPREAYPESGSNELLILNTLPWSRSVIVDEPELRGWTAPAGMLDQFFPRNVPWGGDRPETPLRRVTGQVPALGYAFVSLASTPSGNDLVVGPGLIENAFYRVRIDPATGALVEWLDKELGHDFAGSYRGWRIGQYVYETVESNEDRNALFVVDWTREFFGYWRTDTPFRYHTAESVHVHEPVVEHGRASITVDIVAPGIKAGRCVFSLDSQRKALRIDWEIDKIHVVSPESVFIAFPFALDRPSFRIDLNGIPCTPGQDQLKGSSPNWYLIQRWVDISDGGHGVTVAPLDAPLVQLGGVTTGRWEGAEQEAETPTLMSWALQNHWPVNFKASQGGRIPLRYRLTTHRGQCDDAAAAKWAAEEATPPIVLRDYRRTTEERAGSFIEVPSDAGVLLTAKPAENGDGIIVRLQNLRPAAQQVPVRFATIIPRSACLTSPVEVDDQDLSLEGGVLRVTLEPMAIQSVRLRF